MYVKRRASAQNIDEAEAEISAYVDSAVLYLPFALCWLWGAATQIDLFSNET